MTDPIAANDGALGGAGVAIAKSLDAAAVAGAKTAAGIAASEAEVRRIVVSLYPPTITISKDGTVVRTITNFSTGRPGHLTPLFNGKLDPNRRYVTHTSSTYHAPMPYSLFLEGNSGIAFHVGRTDHESHGCIHLSPADAKWLFNWAGKHDVNVQIQGPRPPVHHSKNSDQKPLIIRSQGASAMPSTREGHNLRGSHGHGHKVRDQNASPPRH